MLRTGSSQVFDEIKERLERAVIYDGYILSLCPFHDDRHPSFFVYPDYYKCKSCSEHGKTENLLNRLEGVFIPKDVSKYPNPFYDWEKRFGGRTEALKFAYRYGKTYPMYMEYVRDRGITPDTISKLKLGYLDGWITIPIFQNKKLVGATARQIEGASRYFNPRGQNRDILFIPNETIIHNSDHIYLVFGIFDAITMFQYGYPVMTTLIGLLNTVGVFEDYRKKIIVIPDRGEEKTAARLTSKLGWRGNLKTLEYPLGTKDINDLHRKGYDVKEIIK